LRTTKEGNKSPVKHTSPKQEPILSKTAVGPDRVTVEQNGKFVVAAGSERNSRVSNTTLPVLVQTYAPK